MLSTRRIKTLMDEVERIKNQQNQSKQNVCALLSKIHYKFREKSFNKSVISADYVYICDDTEKYRPDNAIYVLLETETRYIQFSIRMTCKNSETNTRIWITMNKNIDPTIIDFEYAFDDTGFIEVYNKKDEKQKYGLSKFEKYMVKLIVDGEMQDWDLEPPKKSRQNGVPVWYGDGFTSNDSISDEDEQLIQDTDPLNNIGTLWE